MKTLLLALFVACSLDAQNYAPIVSVSNPVPNGSGSSIHFHVEVTDPNGVNDVGWLGVGVGTGWLSNPGVFILAYPNQNYIVIQSDAGVWNGPYTIGGPFTAQNSQGSIDMASFTRTVYPSGPTYGAGSMVLDFTINTKAPFVGQRYTYAIASDLAGWYGGGNPVSGWYVTLPQTYVYDSSVSSHYNFPSEAATDNYTGASTFLPTSLSPAPAVAIAGNPAILHAGDTYAVSVRWGKPNTQVWGREFTADIPTPEFYKPNAAGNVIAPVSALSFKGGWYLGNTDSSGYFLLSGRVPAGTEGQHFITLWVSNNTGTQQSTDGGLYTDTLFDSNSVGAAGFFMQAPGGPPPPNYSIVRTSRGERRVPRMAQFQVHQPTSSYKRVGEKWEYTLDADTTKAKLINYGDDRGYAGEAGPNNPNFQDQNGFDGDGAGWTASDNSLRSQHSIFKIVSDWLPGPVSVLFSAGMPKMDPEEYTTYQDAVSMIAANGMKATAVRRNVIGPAIPPQHNEKSLKHLIKNWVDEGNDFLIPLTKDGINLSEALEGMGVGEGYQRDVIQCIQAALASGPSRE